MINTSDDKSRARAAKETEVRTKRRALQAQIVAGLQSLLESDEQLLGFTRGVIAGGLRGKLTVGFEALFAPNVNIGLTERRIVLQHVQPETGRPNEILPHSFPLSDLNTVAFTDIETFGGEPAGRLNLRLYNDLHFRLRFESAQMVDHARTIADVFASLTSTRPKSRTSPTQSLCPHCDRVLDRVSRFCPYCGHSIGPAPETNNADSPSADAFHSDDARAEAQGEPVAEAVTEAPSGIAEGRTEDAESEAAPENVQHEMTGTAEAEESHFDSVQIEDDAAALAETATEPVEVSRPAKRRERAAKADKNREEEQTEGDSAI